MEDNLVNQTVVSEMLRDCQVSLDITENGQEAIAHLQQDDQVDLILMDCQMPVMDGFEATRKIREGLAGRRAASIPVIALTANAMKGDGEACLDAGMNDYLSKPLKIEALQSVLYRWLS